jgi:hypothetical protein
MHRDPQTPPGPATSDINGTSPHRRLSQSILELVRRSTTIQKGSVLTELAPNLVFLAFVVGLPFGLAIAPSVFRDGDVSWQLAAGEWILRNGHIPTTDPFSYTAASHPWVAMEWLSEVVQAAAFRLDGYAGLAALVAAFMITLNAILFFYLEPRTTTLRIACTLFLVNVVLAPFVMARPHVLAWPLLAGWTTTLLAASERGRPPRWWAASILVIWANVHPSFPVGLAIVAAVAVDSIIETQGKNYRSWLGFGAVSAAAVLLNANGLAGVAQPFRTTNLAMLQYIGEWHPSSVHATPYFFVVLLVGLGAILFSGIRVPIGRLTLLLILLWMAFAHTRLQSAFVIVAACMVPGLAASERARVSVPKWLLAASLPFLAFRALTTLIPPESTANPRGLIAAIPPGLRSEHVFNGYSFGGPLILAGVRPYIDGRGELYGDEFVENYLDIADGNLAAFDRAAQRYDIRWTMLPVEDERLIVELESSRGWRRVYADRIGVIDVRPPLGPERRIPAQSTPSL